MIGEFLDSLYSFTFDCRKFASLSWAALSPAGQSSIFTACDCKNFKADKLLFAGKYFLAGWGLVISKNSNSKFSIHLRLNGVKTEKELP